MKKDNFLMTLLAAVFFLSTTELDAQVGIGTNNPAASAQLEISSTTKGLLPPRMTTVQRDAISSPATGLVIFNTTTNSLEIRNSSAWASLSTVADALPTIQIGSQKWMSKNLDVAFYRNGDPIPQVTNATAWAALTTGAWCYYDNDPTQGNKYGKLYNWYAVNDPRGLAPQGWHVPSDAEWTTLETTLGGSSVAGGKMKEAGTVNWTTPNTAADNSSSFAGLPGGSRTLTMESPPTMTSMFLSLGNAGGWWSSTLDGATNNAYLRAVNHNVASVTRGADYKEIGWSVRCIKD